jgi:hypothetical protein
VDKYVYIEAYAILRHKKGCREAGISYDVDAPGKIAAAKYEDPSRWVEGEWWGFFAVRREAGLRRFEGRPGVGSTVVVVGSGMGGGRERCCKQLK